MRKLEIDFTGRGARARWPGRVLFALALAFAFETGLSYRDAKSELGHLEGRLAQTPPAAAAPRKVPAEEIAAVRETVDRLSMPWDRLFGALESAASEQVALLGIEPDAKAGTVVISGDSKDYLAALSYVLNLGRSEALEGVRLVRHEVKSDDPHAPVSFAVSAAWREVRPEVKP